MKSIVICSGSITDYDVIRGLIDESTTVICADGGARHAYHMGISPDIIIGDFDSIEALYVDHFKKQNIRVIEYPSDKDKTDTELCLHYAMGISDEVILVGATGTRLDHSIANVMLLVNGVKENKKISLIDERNQVYMIRDSIRLKGSKGDIVSIIPLGEKAEGVTTEGLHYPLVNATLELGSTWGISNYMTTAEAAVSISSGHVLVIKSKD